MDGEQLWRDSAPFVRFLAEWEATWPVLSLASVASPPERTAVISVDVINGFCYQGALASPRVGAIVAPCTQLLQRAYAGGVRDFVLVQEGHTPDAVEFASFPPHGILGTLEAEAVPEYQALPFYTSMTIVRKNSLHAAVDTDLTAWLQARPQLDTFIVIGDCTDLCVYQAAMFLRLQANARNLTRRVIVPADCVATYDLPPETAQAVGAMPHAGDLLHLVFLYSLKLNGVEVIRSLT